MGIVKRQNERQFEWNVAGFAIQQNCLKTKKNKKNKVIPFI